MSSPTLRLRWKTVAQQRLASLGSEHQCVRGLDELLIEPLYTGCTDPEAEFDIGADRFDEVLTLAIRNHVRPLPAFMRTDLSGLMYDVLHRLLINDDEARRRVSLYLEMRAEPVSAA